MFSIICGEVPPQYWAMDIEPKEPKHPNASWTFGDSIILYLVPVSDLDN